jgi:tetratricopeptide (TPR) repeat protein
MVQFSDWTNAIRASGLNVVANSQGDHLIVRTLSPSAAVIYYAQGLELFKGGQLDEAAAKFQNAAIESPKEQVYRYWLILSELRMGRRESAYKRLNALVRRGEYTPSNEVYASLERIQGPLRMELVAMEAEAKAGLPYSEPHAQTKYTYPACNRSF